MDLVGRALDFARQAYGPERDLAHPVEVVRIVQSIGAPDELAAAAALHDVLEDTEARPELIAATFGSRIAALVCTLTEDEAIRNYAERKADLRARACAAGADAALLSVADKLSNVRRMRRGEKTYKERKFAHYRATLELMRREHPSLPLLDRLDRELAALDRSRQITV